MSSKPRCMPWLNSRVYAWRCCRKANPSAAAAMCCTTRARKGCMARPLPPPELGGGPRAMTETLTRTHSILRPVENGPIVHAWDHGVPVEPDVWKQVAHLASVPGVERIAIMPDAHIGKGACVGSAILTREIVIPAAVGVDIGCGMIAAPLSLGRSDLRDLPLIRAEIERRVPVGRTNRGQSGDRGAWGKIPDDVLVAWKKHLEAGYRAMTGMWHELAHPFAINHLGTLGTGNHFIEVC